MAGVRAVPARVREQLHPAPTPPLHPPWEQMHHPPHPPPPPPLGRRARARRALLCGPPPHPPKPGGAGLVGSRDEGGDLCCSAPPAQRKPALPPGRWQQLALNTHLPFLNTRLCLDPSIHPTPLNTRLCLILRSTPPAPPLCVPSAPLFHATRLACLPSAPSRLPPCQPSRARSAAQLVAQWEKAWGGERRAQRALARAWGKGGWAGLGALQQHTVRTPMSAPCRCTSGKQQQAITACQTRRQSIGPSGCPAAAAGGGAPAAAGGAGGEGGEPPPPTPQTPGTWLPWPAVHALLQRQPACAAPRSARHWGGVGGWVGGGGVEGERGGEGGVGCKQASGWVGGWVGKDGTVGAQPSCSAHRCMWRVIT